MKHPIIALLAIALISFSISCKPKVVLKLSKPDLFLTEDQMVKLFTDAQLVEGALSFKRNKGTLIKDLKNDYYQAMFTNHGITDKIFEENVAYYNQFPEQMEKIYDEVLANLSKTQSMMEVKTEE
jgi:hypothetical protein